VESQEGKEGDEWAQGMRRNGGLAEKDKDGCRSLLLGSVCASRRCLPLQTKAERTVGQPVSGQRESELPEPGHTRQAIHHPMSIKIP